MTNTAFDYEDSPNDEGEEVADTWLFWPPDFLLEIGAGIHGRDFL